MATKAELQALCVGTAEEFLRTHGVEDSVGDWRVNGELGVTDVTAGADVPFKTDFDVVTGPEPDGLFESRSTTADFAVWFATGRTYGEFDGGVLATGEDAPVRVPVLVAEVIGAEFTQMRFPSTAEATFDEADSPYVCRTDLPFLRHRLHPSTRSSGQLFVSDYDVELVPARANPHVLSTDGEITETEVRYAVRFTLAEVLYRASGGEFDVRERVQ